MHQVRGGCHIITFSGTFTDYEIDEIKKNIEQDVGLLDKNLFVTLSKKRQPQLAKWHLESKKVVYVHESTLSNTIENKEKSIMTAANLNQLFTEFFDERYGFVPRFEIKIDASIPLPVAVIFYDYALSSDDRTQQFFLLFERDMYAIKNKHCGGEFEYGDKILQLIYGHYINGYKVIGARSDDEVVFTETDEDGGVVFTVHRDRKIIKKISCEPNDSYTEKHKQEVVDIILHNGDKKTLEKHIQNGFDCSTSVNEGMFALHLAVKEKKHEYVKALVEEGVDINQKDEYGNAPMVYALNNDDLLMIKLLISYDADTIKLKNNGANWYTLCQSKETRKYLVHHL